MSITNKLVSLDFEVFGIVQGKYFHWTSSFFLVWQVGTCHFTRWRQFCLRRMSNCLDFMLLHGTRNLIAICLA